MELYDCGGKITEKVIQNFEEKLGFKLPSDYKEFILINNGGTPTDDLVYDFIDSVTESNNSSDIREFFVFYNGETDNYDDAMGIYSSMIDEGVIDKTFFPIGDDSGGNTLCICVSENDYGSIFFCDHELENKDTGYLVSSKIASSFTEFINMLYIFEED